MLMVGSERLVFKAHFASTVDARLLRLPVASLLEHEHGIKAALDVLIQGSDR
ncbi:CcdB family protein [Sphingomonas sp. BAUL-RG-20F-R05-02]|uniref:CcdB family protein n=1 Tax=Sphingomonas sp. BAUL-RG-20F-R05-02 TaxID=2914830 RepID=UPI0028C49910|nr:CcdB family protein [Sphingomonas sp. BAUL-RG-20F-R05-02]